MSAGPIRSERDAWKPTTVSTTDAARLCFGATGSRGYCGRTSAKERTSDWERVTCADCKAARTADQEAARG